MVVPTRGSLLTMGRGTASGIVSTGRVMAKKAERVRLL